MLAEQKWRREGRNLLRARKRGYSKLTPVGDVFQHLRGDEMSEATAVSVRTLEPIDIPTALAPRREKAGMLAMAEMSDSEFEQRILALKRGQERIKRIKQELMEEDAHYGLIPGTKKPTLLKPGAEVLCSIYSLRADFIPTVEAGDGTTAPHLRVTMRCELHLGDTAGPVVAVGYGSANSWERKHRYRRGERTCPKCGVVGQIIKGKEEYGGGWLCWKSKGGCGAKWADGAPEIEAQQAGDVQNPDPYDLENTLIKMAKKRAHIDAALTGTASSDLFTQDLDDGGPSEKDHAPQPKATTTKPDAKSKAQPAEPVREPGDEAPPSETAACAHCGSVNVIPDPKAPGWLMCQEKACKKGTRVA